MINMSFCRDENLCWSTVLVLILGLQKKKTMSSIIMFWNTQQWYMPQDYTTGQKYTLASQSLWELEVCEFVPT